MLTEHCVNHFAFKQEVYIDTELKFSGKLILHCVGGAIFELLKLAKLSFIRSTTIRGYVFSYPE